jgi:hypothetical protein
VGEVITIETEVAVATITVTTIAVAATTIAMRVTIMAGGAEGTAINPSLGF